jgi:1-acyl-sn-glycerol-3-phosphate acyltransferase
MAIEFLEPIPPGLARAEFMAALQQRIESASDRLIREAEAQMSDSPVGKSVDKNPAPGP